MHVVVLRALHARPQRGVVAFYKIDRAAQKIASAPLLRKPIHLIEKPRCKRVAHENVVTYPSKKVYPRRKIADEKQPRMLDLTWLGINPDGRAVYCR